MNYAIISGVIMGSVYAMVGYGYHLTWITSLTVNFAQGSMLMVGGVAAYVVVRQGVPFPVAVLSSAAVGALVGVLTERLVITRFVGSTHAWVLSTFGLGIVLMAAEAKIWGPDFLGVPSQYAGRTVTIAGAIVTYEQILMVAWSAALLAVIASILRWTMLGKAVRAVAANRRAASLVGISPARISMFAYALASLTSAGLGALLAGSNGVQSDTGLLLGFFAFFAAALGGLESGAGVVAGGLIIGLLEAVVGYYNSLLAQPAILFFMAAVLVARPYGLLGRVPIERV